MSIKPRVWHGLSAALCFAIAGVMFPSAVDWDNGIPAASALIEAHGQVLESDASRYGVKFQLKGRAETFHYASSAGDLSRVKSALYEAGIGKIDVWFERIPYHPLLRSDRYYQVWQFAMDGRVIRSFADCKKSRRSYNVACSLLCVVSLIAGLYLSMRALLARPLRGL